MKNSQEFLIAAETVKQLRSKPSNSSLTMLYGLYKQSTIGDINIEKPNFLNFEGVQKWNSWNAYKGTSQYDAEVKYIILVNKLIQKHGVN
jgi:diazepam-binding inhibitor (GABA receptor modulating acyl-CoA-binding protein)